MQRAGQRTGPLFRYTVLAIAGFWTLVWLASFYPAIRLMHQPYTDGTQWIGPLIASTVFIVLVLPALILGVLGGDRKLGIAAVLLVLTTVFAAVMLL
jgi:hypothetical protein